MAQVVELKSKPGELRDAVVRIALVEPPDDYGCARFEVEAEAERLKVQAPVALFADQGLVGGHANVGLADFLDDLVADWRGWEGAREWESLNRDLTLQATHHGRFIKIVFVFRRDRYPDAWEARVPIALAPGESLSSFARGVRSFWGHS
jgi:Family of unknown function (DUF6228)